MARPPIRARQTEMPWKQVFIEDMSEDGRIAYCVDQYGHHVNIPTTVRRAKGLMPAVGDTWIVDRAIGHRWSFAAVINTTRIVVEGSRGGNEALTSLITALADAGLVIDQTDP